LKAEGTTAIDRYAIHYSRTDDIEHHLLTNMLNSARTYKTLQSERREGKKQRREALGISGPVPTKRAANDACIVEAKRARIDHTNDLF